MAGYLVYCCTATKQSKSLRLDPYVSHSRGSIIVLPAANLKGPPEKCGLLTLVRPSCTLLLCALEPGPVQQHASRQPSSKGIFFFNKLVATGLVFRYFRMLWHEKIFVGDVGLLSPSMIGCSPKGFFLSYRPRDIYLAFLASKTNQLPPLTVVSCRKRQQSSSISVVTTCTPLSSTVVFAFMC